MVWKSKEASHPHHHRSQHLIPDVEVRAGEAATLFGQNAKVGIGGGTLGDSGAQGVAVLPCPMLLRTK